MPKTPEPDVHRFKAGDVVVTKKPVRIDSKGSALPGWKWRIVTAYHDGTKALYDCVAHTAPKAYSCTLYDREVDGKHHEHRT